MRKAEKKPSRGQVYILINNNVRLFQHVVSLFIRIIFYVSAYVCICKETKFATLILSDWGTYTASWVYENDDE